MPPLRIASMPSSIKHCCSGANCLNHSSASVFALVSPCRNADSTSCSIFLGSGLLVVGDELLPLVPFCDMILDSKRRQSPSPAPRGYRLLLVMLPLLQRPIGAPPPPPPSLSVRVIGKALPTTSIRSASGEHPRSNRPKNGYFSRPQQGFVAFVKQDEPISRSPSPLVVVVFVNDSVVC